MQALVVADTPEKLMRDPIRPGAQLQRRLLAVDAPDGLNFWTLWIEYVGGGAYESPRSRFPFQQVRWAVSGAHNYAPGNDIPEGCLAYFPRGAWSGPQRAESGAIFAVQFGFDGEHQRGDRWGPLRTAAIERLNARGTFNDGFYTEVDTGTGKARMREGALAILEETYEMGTGSPYVMPEPRYLEPIVIDPRAFPYFEVAPGVQVKELGRFYDHPGPDGDTRLTVVRLAQGATHAFGTDRTQHVWAASAGLQVEATTYPESTSLYSPRGERSTVSAAETVEMYVIDFARPAKLSLTR